MLPVTRALAASPGTWGQLVAAVTAVLFTALAANASLADLDRALFDDLMPAPSRRCSTRGRAAAETSSWRSNFSYPGSTNATSGYVPAVPRWPGGAAAPAT